MRLLPASAQCGVCCVLQGILMDDEHGFAHGVAVAMSI
jgi:hypothetical protein